MKEIKISLREPVLDDADGFLSAMHRSNAFHHPWVKSPQSSQEFMDFIKRNQQDNQKSLLIIESEVKICGVFNLNEIVRGCFQSAYLGFYSVVDYAGKGYMSSGLKLILKHAFEEMNLHRLEANIQPENMSSINLVKNNAFRKEGYSPRYLKIHEKWCDHERWAITREDWK